MTTDGNERGPMQAAQQNMQRALPKRFYKVVGVAEAEDGHRVLLDGRPARTPRKAFLAMPAAALAEAIAAEWDAQVDTIDPALMPMTRLANTAIDGVTGREAEVWSDVVKYAGSDLLCYRAEGPDKLAHRQAQLWDPVLDWGAERVGGRLAVQSGLMPVPQPEAAISGFARATSGLGAFNLTALHAMTTLTGSALLAFAVVEGFMSHADAWTAAHVDEDHQIAEWGEDFEAAERREQRRREMEAAGRFVELLAAGPRPRDA